MLRLFDSGTPIMGVINRGMPDLEEAVEAIEDGEFGEGSAATGHRR